MTGPESRSVGKRDYSLTGTESRRALDRKLVEAEWYRPPIDPNRLHELMARNDLRASRDTVLWLGLVVGTGVAAWLTLGSWWAVPAFAAYGASYGGAADSRWHEMGHGTAFRTSWPNDVVYYLASFMLMREPTLWRWSHARHHTDTIIVGRDPEIVLQRPTTRWALLATFLGLRVVPPMLWRMARHAAGTPDDDAKEFVPRHEWKRLVWEARAFLGILVSVTVWAITTSSIVPLLFIGLPTIYGAWLLVFFGLTQHAGLQEDVLDHRLNSRTVRMNPFFRFLYSNMNYHVEHHMFPTVPYHALPALHEEVKGHLAPAMPSTVAAYREIFAAVSRQSSDTAYEITNRGVPESSAEETRRPDVGQGIWARPRHDGLADLGGSESVSVGQVCRVDVADRTFALYRLSANDYALTDGLCTHGQVHLADGLVRDCTIECPRHNGRFDIRTGEPLRRPAELALDTYDVHVTDGRLLSDLVARKPEVRPQ